MILRLFVSARTCLVVLVPSAIAINSDARDLPMPILVLSNSSHSAHEPLCCSLSVLRYWPAEM